jgi:hypothetical protein
MDRLRFTNRETQLVALLVKYHLRPTQMSQEGTPTRRAIYRYFRDSGASGIDILFLSLADHLAARGPDLDLEQWREHARMTDYVLNRHFEEESLTHPPKLLDGHDIMRIFRLEPGRRVGELLEALREAQAAGEVKDRQAAIQYMTRMLTGANNSEKKRSRD